MLLNCLSLFFSFLKIGLVGFGGGYAMLSLVFTESQKFGITTTQFADLNALDMVVPGPIAINAATYIGYLASGFWGAAAATLGVMLPSFIIVSIVLHFINRYRENRFMDGLLRGIKPAAVGLIAAAAMTIASDVLFEQGKISLFLAGVFLVTAATNIKFKINPILLTVLAGVAGAVFLK